jgi:large subunit ribosomal protein L35
MTAKRSRGRTVIHRDDGGWARAFAALRYPAPSAMPKMKTHSGAKKRFKLTAKGKVRGRHAYSSHILEKKSPKRKRAFRKPREISPHDAPRIKKMLGVGK